MNHMRILFTGTTGECIPPPYGGIPKRALMLGAEWKKQGVITGYTFNYFNKNADDLGAGGEYFFEFSSKPNKFRKIFYILYYFFANPTLYLHILSLYKKTYKRYTREGFFYSAYGVFLDNVYTTFKPHIIISEAALIQTFVAASVAHKHHIPFVIETYAEVHDKTMTKSLPFTDTERTEYWKKFLGMADHIVTSSNYCALGPRQYVNSDKETMIYATTLHVDRFDRNISTEQKRQLRAKFNIPEDMFVILAVGAFTERKGHDHMIEALGMIHSSHSRIAVALCGAGDPQWLKNLATKRGVSRNTFFFQKLSEDDLTDLYHTADTYCDASNTPRACLGIALTDALAARLPTIAYNIAGLPESVHDGKNGYLVPAHNIEILSQNFIRIAECTPNERIQLGQEGVLIARNIFDIHIIAQKLLDLFTAIAQKK